MGNKGSKKKNTSGQLSDKEIAALKSATNKSEKELRDEYAEFLTEYPAGNLDKKQFKKLYQESRGRPDSDAQFCDNIFAVFDTNRDGTVSYSEFVLVLAAMGNKDIDTSLNLGFELVDTSGDGYITFDEVVAFCNGVAKIGDVNEGDIDETVMARHIFGQLGVQEGQKLSRKQFVEGCKKNQQLTNLFGSFGDM